MKPKAVDAVDDVHDAAKAADNIGDAAKAAKRADGVCFVAGTLVETENGSIPIEEITAGMLVYAHNPDTGETELKEVVQTFVRETNELVHINVNGEEIITTPTHPFWVPEKGWTDAIQLRAGDRLQLLNGEYVIVEQVQHEQLEIPVTVYNFEVEGFHTYYVGDSKVLVHNKCKKQIGEKLEYIFGNATGNKHSVDRSQGLLKQVQSIGINDSPNGRQYIFEQLMEVPDMISELPGKHKYSSLIWGPGGVRQMDSIWDNGKLVTVYIFGGR